MLNSLLIHTSSDAGRSTPDAQTLRIVCSLYRLALDYWPSSLAEAIDDRSDIRRAPAALGMFERVVVIEGHRSPLRRYDGARLHDVLASTVQLTSSLGQLHH